MGALQSASLQSASLQILQAEGRSAGPKARSAGAKRRSAGAALYDSAVDSVRSPCVYRSYRCAQSRPAALAA